MVGIAVYGQFIGSFSSIIKELAEKRIYFERISNSVVESLEELTLPQKVSDEALRFVKLVSLSQLHQLALNDFFVMCSTSLIS